MSGRRRGKRQGLEREKHGKKRKRETERERERQGWREREISSCKNKEYKKAKSFIWMF